MQDFWSPVQQIIKETCSSFDKVWQTRKRVIDTHFLVLFILKLILSKNKQGYKSLLNEVWENSEIILIHQQAQPISASSLCEARQKLPEEIFLKINEKILSMLEKPNVLFEWCGHRIFAADGSRINVPHELLDKNYKIRNQGQYYPQGLMSTLYHLNEGLIYDCILTAEKNERHCLIDQMNTLAIGDVLVLDRGYFSYLLLYQAMEKGVHLICGLQSGTVNKAIEAFWKSDCQDAVIDYYPSVAVKSEIKKQGYDLNYKKISLRLIKYQIDDEIYVCATTLLSKQYPLNEFAKVYHGRWGIEELYKISKEFIDVEDFHAKTERGVKQELYAHILLINIARIFESEANKQLPPSSNNSHQEVETELKKSYWKNFSGKIQELKINFKNCLLVIGRFIEKLILSLEPEKKGWLSKMLLSISRVRQKIRPGRHYPRCSRKPYNRWKSSNDPKLAKA